MAAEFVPNPAFMPAVARVIEDGLEEVLDEAVEEAQANIRPSSSSTAGGVTREPIRSDNEGLAGRIRMGRGLGPIFEFSKEQERRTRRGANRGVMKRREWFHRAIEAVVARGLPLRRRL